MERLQTINLKQWQDSLPRRLQDQAVASLELGQVLFLPQLGFELLAGERKFLSPKYADPGAKNIQYHMDQGKLSGVLRSAKDDEFQLKKMLGRFARSAAQLLHCLFPYYSNALVTGRTSFRPVQIEGRVTSERKDDKRLHVDAFPSSPNQGKRILRVFTNINPWNEPRIWRLGAPFEDVVYRFLPLLPNPLPGLAAVLRGLRVTKSMRSPYDHYMLQLHDHMKADDDYQKTAPQAEFQFPAGASWIVQTDQVSHAVMRGQYVLEQTFYLPVAAMRNEQLSPLRILEKHLGKPLA